MPQMWTMNLKNGNGMTSTENSTPTHDGHDSGYSNTSSNNQSNTSNGSSVSRDSNSSGYHGGNPSTIGSCTKSLPHPITKRKDKEKSHKEKKLKGALVSSIGFGEPSQTLNAVNSLSDPLVIKPLSNHVAEPCQSIFETKAEEVAVVELVDATDPVAHNDSNVATDAEAGLASKTNLIEECSSQFTEEHYAVVSMHDGLVLLATPSLHASLGYSKDSWIGKLFTDFLDPKDKKIFTEKIASEVAVSRDFCSPGANGRKESIFCRLRRFNVPPCEASGPTAECIQYVPYRINLVVQNFHGDKLSLPRDQITLLIITFESVHSAYKEPEETIIPTIFTTRHTSTCHLSYVDPDVVRYLGYLPQDMIDRSLFDFYYPEDLPIIKDIYETIINLKSSSFRSKPYRFIVKNGGVVVLETEWSSFIDPWMKNLEFVVGQHRVLKGPADPNIFNPPSEKNDLMSNISEEVLKEAKIIQKEIMDLLVEGVQRKPYSPVAEHDLLAKKKELTPFVESIIQEINHPAQVKDHMAVDDRSFSEHDSVMLGEISPHHEYYDSKSSTETPPSYNQLNYNDNIERFFNSNLGTTATNNGLYTSDEENFHLYNANSSDEPGKNNNSKAELQYSSSTNGSDNSGSAGNLSSESNNQQSSSFDSLGDTSNMTSTNSTAKSRQKPTTLTESLLNRHNEDMEKLMVQKHREQKKGDKRHKSSLNEQAKPEQPQARGETSNNNNNNNPKPEGRLKRSGSQSREADNNFKMPKYDDSAKLPQNMTQILANANSKFTPTSADAKAKAIPSGAPNMNSNVWPTVTIINPSATTITQQCFTTTNAYSQAVSRFASYPQMMPFYYLPVLQSRETPALAALPREHPGPPNLLNQPAPYCFVPVPYMATTLPTMMYPPMMGAPAPAAMMYRSLIMPEAAASNVMPQASPSTAAMPLRAVPQPAYSPAATAVTNPSAVNPTIASSVDLKQSSKASLKVELDSIMTMSESPKKQLQPKNKEGTNKERQAARKALGMVRREPPWIEGVKLTPELVYQYQLGAKSLDEVLKSDLEFLRQSKQPSLVNDQLEQLFLDLDIEGMGSKLIFEEAGTNSTSDSNSDGSQRES